MRGRNIAVIFRKQVKDILRNKESLLQFVILPIMAVIMTTAIHIDDLPENYFVKMFASMYTGMAPLSVMATIIAEEKEKNTLRVLFLHNVKPVEYLLGTGSVVFLISMVGILVFAFIGGYGVSAFFIFVAILAIGVLISILIGGLLGILSKNQMSATAITLPVMMIISFLPLLAMFNTAIEKVSRIVYSGQISTLIDKVSNMSISAESVIVLSSNIVLAVVAFILAYRRSNLA